MSLGSVNTSKFPHFPKILPGIIRKVVDIAEMEMVSHKTGTLPILSPQRFQNLSNPTKKPSP